MNRLDGFALVLNKAVSLLLLALPGCDNHETTATAVPITEII